MTNPLAGVYNCQSRRCRASCTHSSRPNPVALAVMIRALPLLYLFVFSLNRVVCAGAISEGNVEFLKSNCLDCHTGSESEAGLDLSTLTAELNHASFDTWVSIHDRVRDGEMPPADSDPPPTDKKKAFLEATAQRLTDHQSNEFQTLGRVRARRLTNLQLERTLHDLLGVDIPLARLMPDEPRTDGYNTVAAGQSISHFQLQTHLTVVDAALDEAFRRGTAAKADEWDKTLAPKQFARQNPQRRCREPEMLDGKAVVWKAGTTFYGRLPVTTARQPGWYRMRLKISGLNVPDKHGIWTTVRTGPCVSGAPMLAWSGACEVIEKPLDWTFEAWMDKGDMFEVRPGDSTLNSARFAGGQVGTGEGKPQNVPGIAMHEMQLQRIHKGLDNSEIRQLLFNDLKVTTDKKSKTVRLVSTAPRLDAAKLLRRFAAHAFRRPVDRTAVIPFENLVNANLNKKVPLLEALRIGYRAILCSPRFLHFQETPGQLDDFALASRLSYLLWNTMPDQKLMWQAKAGNLQDPAKLKQQVARMLKDERGRKFVKDFAYQWLDLSEIDFTEPDRRLYGEFDVIVQQSMLQETHAFLQELLDRDASVGNLIDSKFTFLNSRLARFYDIDRVSGDYLRRVQLRSEDKRSGLLTHGSILKVTANGSTTSPVLRGVWVSERLLGVHIPPPPKSVPAIEPDIRGATTIREKLEKHKSDSSCASCHVKIDPPGFALENFDPSGRWRTQYRKKKKPYPKIDASGELPDGGSFESLRGFQKLILRDKASLARNFVRQLLTYGTGAACEFADRGSIEDIVSAAETSGYGMRSLVEAAVLSDTFRSK